MLRSLIQLTALPAVVLIDPFHGARSTFLTKVYLFRIDVQHVELETEYSIDIDLIADTHRTWIPPICDAPTIIINLITYGRFRFSVADVE